MTMSFVSTPGSSARLIVVAAWWLATVSACYGNPQISGHDAGVGPGGSGGDGIAGKGGMSGTGEASGQGGATGGAAGVGAAGGSSCSTPTVSDPMNCGACGHDCLGATCDAGQCRPFKLAAIPHESARTIGVSPEYVLVGGTTYLNGAAPIYLVRKNDGAVTRTRSQRVDGSYSRRLAGTTATLVAADVYTPGTALYYLSHCSITDCGTTVPPVGSYTFDGIRDFALDSARGRVFWFDPTSNELISTNADAWSPASFGPVSVTGHADCLAMAQGTGTIFGAFDYGVFAVSEDGDATPRIVSGVPSEALVVDIAASPEALILLLSSGTLLKAPLPAGIGNKLPDAIPGISGVTAIATSGSTLFWAGTSTIYRCSLPLCSQITPIAQDAAVVADIVADDRALYWLSRPDIADPTSGIMRLVF